MAEGHGDAPEHEITREDIPSMQALRAYEFGWAARIIPVRSGWRVAYYSHSDFEGERGTDFQTLDEALAAVAELLPKANSEDEREKARDLEEILWLMLQERAAQDESGGG